MRRKIERVVARKRAWDGVVTSRLPFCGGLVVCLMLLSTPMVACFEVSYPALKVNGLSTYMRMRYVSELR